jgi:thiamine monophosphate synthase
VTAAGLGADRVNIPISLKSIPESAIEVVDSRREESAYFSIGEKEVVGKSAVIEEIDRLLRSGKCAKVVVLRFTGLTRREGVKSISPDLVEYCLKRECDFVVHGPRKWAEHPEAVLQVRSSMSAFKK